MPQLDDRLLNELRQVVGAEHLISQADELAPYGQDWTEDLHHPPDAVVRPSSTAEVAACLRLGYQAGVPLVPIGGRTGLSGGMLAVEGGLGISLERLNQILWVDAASFQLRCQAGCILQHVMDAAEAKDLMYPVDPSSKASCLVGGNIATGAGGARAVKYGVTRDNVLALTAVLPNGTVLNTGANVLKNSTGYDLTRLLVGSEGTLAVVTEATLRLRPLPGQRRLVWAPFPSLEEAGKAVESVFHTGITPSALELMERDALRFGQAFLGRQVLDVEAGEGHLMIELDGHNADALDAELNTLHQTLEAHGAATVWLADAPQKAEAWWQLRRALGQAVKAESVYKEEDTVVPRAKLPELLRFVKHLAAVHGFRAICYGHAGDGNLHVNILRDQLSKEAWDQRLPAAIEALFRYVVDLGGTLSGEHGVGYVQRRYLHLAVSEAEMDLMRQIKAVFDPKGLLNPSKVLP